MSIEQPDSSLNGAWLGKLLIEKHVQKPRANWSLSDQALAVLAVHIRFRAWRQQNPWAPSQGTEVFYEETGDSAARVLLADLESRLDGWRAALAGYQGGDYDHKLPWETETQGTRVTALIAKLERAIDAVTAILPSLKPTISPSPVSNWHNHATPLAKDFLRRLRECNPNPLTGVSNTGPVAAFVAAVVPHITGEAPTVNAVAGFLKERRALLN